MDFLSGLAKGGDQSKPTPDQPNKPDRLQADEPSTNSDLFASAKVVADAAQAQFRNEPEKYDKTKVAGAAASLLEAASEYGKLDETKGAGKYVGQAENYLRQYRISESADTPASGEHKTDRNDVVPSPTVEKTAPAAVSETTEAQKPSGGGGNTAAAYVKMAEGLLNKLADGDGSGDSTENPGSRYGDLMKMAGGFLKK